MARKNRRDDSHRRIRERKARSEYALAGVLSYPDRADDEQDAEHEPATVGQP